MDIEGAVEYRPVNRTSKCKIIFYTCICTVFILTLLYASALTFLYFIKNEHNTTNINNNSLIQINENHDSNGLICRIPIIERNIHEYPSGEKFIYAINFNETIMQANYVYYITTNGGNGCKNKNRKTYWLKDPYDIDNIRYDDYTNTKYQRGHLVPNADYGCDTYYISNAVPMIGDFNQNSWAESEKYIRQEYAGKLVYKGCDYSDNYILTNRGNKLFIPIGCYYIIFDSSTLTDINKETVNKVLDYGYYLNEKGSKKQSKLPTWADCSFNTVSTTGTTTNSNTGIIPLINNSINMKIFASGIHKITPKDYNFKDNIIVEAWGAGGAGCTCSGYSIGGGSGGYIKSSIKTEQSTFNITVGSGMKGNITQNYCYLINNPIGMTTIKKNNITLFSAGAGGTCDIPAFFLQNGGKNIINNIKNVLSLNGNSGIYGDSTNCGQMLRAHNGIITKLNCRGAHAPYGGRGGNGCFLPYINAQNGDSPAGGGGSGINKRENILLNADGADGGFIIYY